MKRLRWSSAAANDLEEINFYLSHNHSSFALPTLQRIYAAARALRKSPAKGRKGRISNTRELGLAPPPYLIVYALEGGFVHIIRIVHGAQDWA